jgi:hypothetical protein
MTNQTPNSKIVEILESYRMDWDKIHRDWEGDSDDEKSLSCKATALAEAATQLQQLRETAVLEGRLDELIWSTGAGYKYDKDRQIVQDRIVELQSQTGEKI